ncbi:transcription initiation factor TFIID subunit 4-like [Corvus cornix cornix]|uniref:transcription initiation factor TFIID subunit 4-like n=1 Tax=Corvus cornix cornix TaxID=932674 RepID=UPI00195024FB|nr:transcription initiation factor TFIID subunit 4-like [Corvus cornix cornix]XP_039423963.1 transcription initiation factor TFIID subunit 4-like [Corvus cornix cornix]
MPGSTFLAGIAPGVTALRLPGCAPLPSMALDCPAPLQNRAIDLLIQHLPLLTELLNVSRKLEELLSLQKQLLQITEASRHAGCTGPMPPAPPAPPAGAVAPNQEAAWPAVNPEAAGAAATPQPAAAPNAAAEQGPAAVPGTGAVEETSTAPGAAAAQGTATAPNAAAEQETSTALGAAAAPETAAAAPVPVRWGPAETASRKDAAVQTAVQPAVVCAVCSASSQPSQCAPLRPPLFTPSVVSELPLPDDSSSGSEADEVLAPGRQAAVARW